MNELRGPDYSDTILNRLGIACTVLFLISYLTHLGIIPLDIQTDEPRRALVSLEMILSGDYITPTLNGELYLNKPPLYNWIMIAYLKASGSYNAFWLRLPVIVAIAVFGWLVYYFNRKYTTKMVAMVAAFAFITNGRILIYDSFQGLIDLTFGFCMYWLMMLVFHFGEQKKYWQLFIYTYLLTAGGYMMKGLPALVFEAITLLTYFIYKKRFRVLFSIQHIVSILLLFTILGLYYFSYFTRNHITPASLFENLLTESTKRTAVRYGIWYSIFHFLYYPFAMLYHYAPWFLLALLLLRKNVFRVINGHPFIKFNWWAFFFNFLIYWTSPEVYARYLFPLLAPLFTVLVYLFYHWYQENNWQRRVPELVFGWALVVAASGLLFINFTPALAKVSMAWPKAIFIAGVLGGLAWYYFRLPVYRLMVFALALFVVRIGFNWFVIDQRGRKLRQWDATGAAIDSITRNQPLFIEKGAYPGNFDGMSYHISRRRREILRYSPADTTHFFLTDSIQLAGRQYDSYLDFRNFDNIHVWLVRYRRLSNGLPSGVSEH